MEIILITNNKELFLGDTFKNYPNTPDHKYKLATFNEIINSEKTYKLIVFDICASNENFVRQLIQLNTLTSTIILLVDKLLDPFEDLGSALGASMILYKPTSPEKIDLAINRILAAQSPHKTDSL